MKGGLRALGIGGFLGRMISGCVLIRVQPSCHETSKKHETRGNEFNIQDLAFPET